MTQYIILQHVHALYRRTGWSLPASCAPASSDQMRCNLLGNGLGLHRKFPRNGTAAHTIWHCLIANIVSRFVILCSYHMYACIYMYTATHVYMYGNVCTQMYVWDLKGYNEMTWHGMEWHGMSWSYVCMYEYVCVYACMHVRTRVCVVL